MNVVTTARRLGMLGMAYKACDLAIRTGKNYYYRWSTRNAPRYHSPTPAELQQIESDLGSLGVQVTDYAPSEQEFKDFLDANHFPVDYHGGANSGVWHEKILEHWLSMNLLALNNFGHDDVYVDIAASSSPWATTVRDKMQISAFAIDLELPQERAQLPYYRIENATATSFDNSSVRGASLHCAYEMFTRDDDIALLTEISRILVPGGKLVILPLYMHTHYCAYSTPEYYGQGFSDPQATEYVRTDCFGVRSSRKYDAKTLLNRVLRPIEKLGMTYRLLALRNKHEFGPDIYCHFILEVTR